MTRDEAVDAWLTAMWRQTPQTFMAPVEGAAIACRGWNLAAVDRPGIVLVHGFFAHAEWWDHIAPALAERHRVVAFSFSGMGDSDRRAAYAPEQHGREILGVAAAAGIDRPIVIAHSYGAIAALMAARAQPAAMQRIIVLDSGLPAPGEVRDPAPARPQRLYPDRESALARFRLIPPGGWPHPRILRHVAETSLVEQPGGGWTWKFDAMMPERMVRGAYRAALLGVTVPADLIYGDRSEVFTPQRRASAREIVTVCGPFVVIPACHHHLMIEQPVALVAALQALLAGAPAGEDATPSG